MAGRESKGNPSSSVPVSDWTDWILIGNVTVGTPPQNLRVGFSIWHQDMYVIGDKASSSDRKGKNAYSASQSISSSTNNNTFRLDDPTKITGVLVNDVVNIGGQNLNLTFGNADKLEYGSFLLETPVDAFLGLSESASTTGAPSVLQQLVGQLAQPIIVINTNRYGSYEASNDDSEAVVNEITFGTADANGCDAATWQWNPSDKGGTYYGGEDWSATWGNLNATSYSVNMGTADQPNITSPFSVSHEVYIVDWFGFPTFSRQFLKLLALASGATCTDRSCLKYTLPCENVASAKDVVIGLNNGGSLVLTPNDYIVQTTDECYMQSNSWYDEHDQYADRQSIYLGQQYMNNHCIGYDIGKSAVGISNKIAAASSPEV